MLPRRVHGYLERVDDGCVEHGTSGADAGMGSQRHPGTFAGAPAYDLAEDREGLRCCFTQSHSLFLLFGVSCVAGITVHMLDTSTAAMRGGSSPYVV